MQQKMKEAFDRLSQTCSGNLTMQIILTSESTTTVTSMQALAMELASTAALLGLGWVGGCVRMCLRAWMVPGTSRGLHTCSPLFCYWVSSNQLLNNQGEIESGTVNCKVNAMTLLRARAWTALVQVQCAKIRPLFLPPEKVPVCQN